MIIILKYYNTKDKHKTNNLILITWIMVLIILKIIILKIVINKNLSNLIIKLTNWNPKIKIFY